MGKEKETAVVVAVDKKVMKKGQWSHNINETMVEAQASGKSVFTAANGDTLEIAVIDLFMETWNGFDAVQKMTIFNGVAQKIMDKTAGKATDEKLELMAGSFNDLKDGVWNRGKGKLTEEQKRWNSEVKSLQQVVKNDKLKPHQLKVLKELGFTV